MDLPRLAAKALGTGEPYRDKMMKDNLGVAGQFCPVPPQVLLVEI